jgi:type III secretion protein R
MINNVDPISLALFLAGLSLLPFVLITTTSFLKISMVLLITRNAIGVQQVPPSMAIYGIAMIMTFYVMAPTFQTMSERLNEQQSTSSAARRGLESFVKVAEPLREFMLKHAREEQRDRFLDKAKRLWPEEQARAATSKDFVVLVPAFMVSEIQAGFEMGFLIYIPFVVIDMIVSNLLLALGMQMVSPMTVSLPFKLFVFVVVDGWGRLLDALLNTYM